MLGLTSETECCENLTVFKTTDIDQFREFQLGFGCEEGSRAENSTIEYEEGTYEAEFGKAKPEIHIE